MSLFKRRKRADPAQASAPSIAGIPDVVVATKDFDVVVRQLIAQMVPAGTAVKELDSDSIEAGYNTT